MPCLATLAARRQQKKRNCHQYDGTHETRRMLVEPGWGADACLVGANSGPRGGVLVDVPGASRGDIRGGFLAGLEPDA